MAQGPLPRVPVASAPRAHIRWRSDSRAQRHIGQVVYRDSCTVVLQAGAMRQYSIVATLLVLASQESCQVDPNCFNRIHRTGISIGVR